MSGDNLYYHFTGATLRDGSAVPAIGQWLKHDGPIVVCESGLHASRHPFDALQYAPGAIFHRVKLRGDIRHQTNKSVARERLIEASIDMGDLLRGFARAVALDLADLWDPPSVVLQYLLDRHKEQMDSVIRELWDVGEQNNIFNVVLDQNYKLSNRTVAIATTMAAILADRFSMNRMETLYDAWTVYAIVKRAQSKGDALGASGEIHSEHADFTKTWPGAPAVARATVQAASLAVDRGTILKYREDFGVLATNALQTT